MESLTSLNQTVTKYETNKENTKVGVNQKRKKLSDITNILDSSRVTSSNAHLQENQNEVSCIITKESIGQLIKENATLVKAIGERNKIIELSNIELQKLQSTVEKANLQNRMLALANSQMLAELTSGKERLKALQHELGCTMAVLRLKNLALDEKDKLNKELNAKIIDEEKLNSELYEKTRAEKELSMCAEFVAGTSLSHSGTNSMVQSRRWTLGNKSNMNKAHALGSTALTDQAEGEKPDNEPDKKIRAEEEKLNRELNEKNNAEVFCNIHIFTEIVEQHIFIVCLKLLVISNVEENSKCTEVATDASGCHSVNINTGYKPSRRILRSQNLGASAVLRHQVEAKEKDTRRKSSRKRSNIDFTSETHESKDNLLDIDNVEVPSCLAISEPPNEHNPVQAKSSATVSYQMEADSKDDTRIVRSSRRRSNSQKSEQSKEHFASTADIRACSPITEPTNKDNPIEERASAPSNSDALLKHEESKTQNSHRISVGRTMRRAAEKVTSYKEISLKVKMRRNE